MTKSLAVMVLFVLPLFSFSQSSSLTSLHEKYKSDNVFSLSVAGDILKCLTETDLAADDPELKEFFKAVQSLHILAVSNDSKKYSPRDIRKLKREIKRQSFEELVSLKADGGQLQVWLRDRKGKPGELVMIIDKDDEGFITMDLSGAKK